MNLAPDQKIAESGLTSEPNELKRAACAWRSAGIPATTAKFAAWIFCKAKSGRRCLNAGPV
jgi:hypothetical protein